MTFAYTCLSSPRQSRLQRVNRITKLVAGHSGLPHVHGNHDTLAMCLITMHIYNSSWYRSFMWSCAKFGHLDTRYSTQRELLHYDKLKLPSCPRKTSVEGEEANKPPNPPLDLVRQSLLDQRLLVRKQILHARMHSSWQ